MYVFSIHLSLLLFFAGTATSPLTHLFAFLCPCYFYSLFPLLLLYVYLFFYLYVTLSSLPSPLVLSHNLSPSLFSFVSLNVPFSLSHNYTHLSLQLSLILSYTLLFPYSFSHTISLLSHYNPPSLSLFSLLLIAELPKTTHRQTKK